MDVRILSPQREIYKGTAASVKAPGVDGYFQVLDGHAPMVSELAEGTVTLKLENGEQLTFSIEKGFLEVIQNEVALLVQEGNSDEEEN